MAEAAPEARRRITTALSLYAALTVIFFAVAPSERVWQHTPFNHFALLARSWVEGRLDLGGPPPAYTHNNDFALFDGKWFVVFPPFPAVLLLPAALIAESAEKIRDGQIFLWLAGVGPALLFLALERLRDLGRSRHDERRNLAFATLFALGTVYWFTAEQGTVWFAAHVVGVALASLYLWASLGASHPLVAGLALGLGYLTRAPLLFAFPLFVYEAYHASRQQSDDPATQNRALARSLALFAVPAVALFALSMAHNRARFGDPFEVGYRYLTVAWRARIERWGLMSYHYLARNLGVLLTSLPYHNKPPTDAAPFQISLHGLALWVTTPAYLFLLRPRITPRTWRACALTALCVAIPSLLYQNTGQSQFGYRFSNDYAPFLFVMLAVSLPRPPRLFWALGALGIAINLFGALSFERPAFSRFYHRTDYSIYQPD